jgi:hypothetical protein
MLVAEPPEAAKPHLTLVGAAKYCATTFGTVTTEGGETTFKYIV